MPSSNEPPKKGHPDMTKIHALLEMGGTSVAHLPPPAERVRLRRSQGLTQAQVADALGVTPGAVGSWEKGRYDPKGDTREQYAELLRLIAERHPNTDKAEEPEQ